jgi:uncharacterized membrane-anchored protein
MNKWGKKGLLAFFVAMVILQLYVPISMLFSLETILKKGEIYKLIMNPIDPNDPFRGKYLILNFNPSVLAVNNELFDYQESAYVQFKLNPEGFHEVASISKEEPSSTSAYLAVNVQYQNGDTVFFNYPFDRFYVEEFKAQNAETYYFESLADTSMNCYASVAIYNGKAVVKDVYVNETPLLKLIQP